MISLGRAANFIDNLKASIISAAFVAVVEDQKEEISRWIHTKMKPHFLKCCVMCVQLQVGFQAK